MSIITVENLSKRYRIGLAEKRHETFSGAIASAIMSPFRNFQRLKKLISFNDDNTDDTIWALKDIHFNVEEGEVLGIIGSNGAGKSTLLKILAQITEPTTGRIELRGRIASLLEVGTGFNGELTGRENVYLNGTILGMSKKEIDRKFDEIVAFSGISQFIDTPVKRYSSGMTVRLAFAVAAHLDPEILIIDEVLAVGDSEFQDKCLGKMNNVAASGRTILFVSHNLAMVQSLCSRSILLEKGKIIYNGDTYKTISHYRKSKNIGSFEREEKSVNHAAITHAEFRDSTGILTTSYFIDDPVNLKLSIANPGKKKLEVHVSFWDLFNNKLWGFTHNMHKLPPLPDKEHLEVVLTFYPPMLNTQEVYVHLALSVADETKKIVDHLQNVLSYAIKKRNMNISSNQDTLFYSNAKLTIL